MRRTFLAIFSVCALAACSPQAPTGQDTNADAGGSGAFPNLTGVSYRAEATLSNAEGQSMPIVMVRDGGNVRMEFNSGHGPSTFISNAQNGESYVITSQGGRMMAIRASGMTEGITDPTANWQGELADQNATRTGNCSVAGESGAEWTKTTPEDGTDSVCVTDDGIILRATDDGRVVWETTSVQRGPQDASQFALPEGVQVMDLGNMGAAMNQVLEAAKQRGH
ncbi:MAG: hypothetical protein R3C31_06440 [Hyphomonadaceae bacterium]